MIALAGDPSHALRERFEARLAQTLVSEGRVTREGIEQALAQQVIFGGHLATSLFELGILDGVQITEVSTRLLGIPAADPRQVAAAPAEVRRLLPPEFAVRTRMIPFARDGRTLKVAMAEPWDVARIEEAGRQAGCGVVPAFLGEVPVERLLRRLYGAPVSGRFETMNQRRAMYTRTAEKKTDEPTEDLMSEASFEALYAREEDGAGGPGDAAAPAKSDALGPDDVLDAIEVSLAPEEDLPAAEVLELGPEDEVEAALPPPIETLEEAVAALAAASHRHEVGDVLTRFARSKGERVALLIRMGRVWTGWVAAGEGIRPSRLRSLVAPSEPGTVFGLVADTGSHYLGPLVDHPVHKRFLRALGGAKPRTVGLFPVHYKGKVVFGVYLDGGDDAFVTTDIADLLLLAQRVPEALERVVQRRLSA